MTSTKFKEGENVLCREEDGLIYDAKICEIKQEDSKTKYKIHYKGWSNRYDTWVDEDKLMPNSQENKNLQQQLKKKHKPPTTGLTSSDTKETKQKGRKKRKFSDQEVNTIPLPNTFKKKLIQDWEYIQQQKKLYELPQKVTINDLFDEFIADVYKTKSRCEKLQFLLTVYIRYSEECEIVELVLRGLREYFNACLDKILLYKTEKKQFKEITKRLKKSPCEIYGQEHLFRFFVKLPFLLKQTQMEPEAIQVINDKVEMLYKFLDRKLV